MPKLSTTRKQGLEWRALRSGTSFIMRHPRTVTASAGLTAAVVEFGPMMTGSVLGGTALLGACMYRGAPRTWDATVGPAVSAWWRRWTRYARRWERDLFGCGLVRRGTDGQSHVPRLRRVRVRGSWDVVYVEMLPGQKPEDYEEAAPALAACWRSDRVVVHQMAPHRLALMVERGDPFGQGSMPVLPAEIPPTSELVDLGGLDVGAFEHGEAFELGLLATHVLTIGATRSGKSGLLWAPLRQLGPMIRDGLVRIHGIDLKGGAEMDPGLPLYYRYARGPVGGLKVLRQVVQEMEQRQDQVRAAGRRKFSHSEAEPFELIMIDELMVLTSLADNKTRLEAQRLIGKILTQGAGLGYCLMAYVQDPTTEGVPMRRFFPVRIALRLDQANHVDIVLGEGSRERGALADLIAADQQGVGYVVIDGVREPRRFRLSMISDDDIAELVQTCCPGTTPEVFDEPRDAGGGDSLGLAV